MTAWTLAAIGLILGGWLIAFMLDRGGSVKAREAKVASGVVTRLVVAASLVSVIAHLVRSQDALQLVLATVVGVSLPSSGRWLG
jgi:hypothetical protein